MINKITISCFAQTELVRLPEKMIHSTTFDLFSCWLHDVRFSGIVKVNEYVNHVTVKLNLNADSFEFFFDYFSILW
jgi:hypothetical protein